MGTCNPKFTKKVGRGPSRFAAAHAPLSPEKKNIRRDNAAAMPPSSVECSKPRKAGWLCSHAARRPMVHLS